MFLFLQKMEGLYAKLYDKYTTLKVSLLFFLFSNLYKILEAFFLYFVVYDLIHDFHFFLE